jgi:hypothetical protein
MKASRKVFALLSVALPLMLIASMTAHAEGSSSSSQSSSKSSQSSSKSLESSSSSSISCPNVDEMVRKCESNKQIAEKFWEDGCTRIKCRDDWRASSSSSQNFICLDIQPMLDRCAKAGGTATTAERNGCKVVECKLSSTWSSSSWSSSTSSTIMCKRTMVANCKVYTCDDGTVDRVCGNSQDKPKLPPAPKGPCTDIERAIIEVKAALEKNPGSVELQQKLNDLTQKFAACRNQNQSSSSIGGPSTTNLGCKTELIDGCKVTRCGIRVMRSCPNGSSSSAN